ncbi:MAG: PHB depolymerase family esterase [Myxococcota bacterium]|nr:PHB depolymerase family esterase [Myxococcota bacterium]
MHRLALASGVACLALTGAAPAASLAPGDHEISLRHDGRERFYLVHVPPAASAGEALPVVLSFHGGGGTPESQREKTGLDDLADAEGFLSVHPGGSPGRRFERRFLTWNAGACCGAAARSGADDVGFVLALLRDLAARIPVDASRVYAMGHSNGAMMSMRLAHEAGRTFAAIAPVGGVAPVFDGPPEHPVPMLQMHSVDDPRALYEGGLGPPFPVTGTRVEHAAVGPVLSAWAERSGCSGGPVESEVLGAEGGSDVAGQRATHLVWTGCRAAVEHWRLQGVGHGWPGAEPRSARIQELLGPPTRILDATREAWRFFEGRSRPEAPPLS